MSSDKADDTVEKVVGTGGQESVVIWLHGLGADATDFVDVIPLLGLPQDRLTRFVFPNAPVRPVTINGGLPCRAWFDIYSLDRWDRRDDAGISVSVSRVHQLIDQAIASGVPSHRIVVVGFSQGGMVALMAGLQCAHPLAGIVGLSTGLPIELSEGQAIQAAHRQCAPVLLMHGEADEVLSIELGRYSDRLLQTLGLKVEFKSYSMGHAVCPQQLDFLGGWLLDKTTPQMF